MTKAFASVRDMEAKKMSCSKVGRDLYAFTSEDDPNTGAIIGNNGVMVADAQAAPVRDWLVVDKIRSVTDKPVKYVVRVLGASAYSAQQGTASEKCHAMILERGNEEWAPMLQWQLRPHVETRLLVARLSAKLSALRAILCNRLTGRWHKLQSEAVH